MKTKIISIILCLILSFSLFTLDNSKNTASATTEKVYVGGCPIGVDLNIDGVLVAGKADVLTEKGLISTSKFVNIEVGDIIKKINGKTVQSVKDLQTACTNSASALKLEIKRGDIVLYTEITPVIESATKQKKLGLVIKDSIQGVGTLTFQKENKTFGALGHPASSHNADNPTPISGGYTKNCAIMGVTRGVKGKAGALRGVFVENNQMRGRVFSNETSGIFGLLEEKFENKIYPNGLEIGAKSEVKTGHASILSTVDGKELKEYDIEIQSRNYEKSSTDVRMVLKITDQELLDKTGGIVQGMSGSPIIQNGKIIGAVTHVFVNDPTRGYGIFIEKMLCKL